MKKENDPKRPPFIIGITGSMKLTDKQKENVKEKIKQVFEWIVASDGYLKEDGTFIQTDEDEGSDEIITSRKALGLKHTPIILLSSLAPGVDTIAAEVALEYAEKKEHSIKVRCPLPFSPDVYRDASTFKTTQAKEDYDELLKKIREQADWDEDLDIFKVALNPKWEGNENSDLKGLDTKTRPRRYLRYRAAGEYVAAYSELLLAIYDEEEPPKKGGSDDLWTCGSSAIAEVKRRGLTWGFLAVSNSFTWADNGPVLYIPLDENEKNEFRHPYDCQPKKKGKCPESNRSTESNKDCEDKGNYIFRRILNLREEFNCHDQEDRRDKDIIEKKELYRMLQKDTSQDLKDELGEDSAERASKLDSLCRVRRRAASKAAQLENSESKLLKKLILLTGIIALSFSAFEHWIYPLRESPYFVSSGGAWWQVSLLFICLGSLLLSAILYHQHLCSKEEQKRFDYRSLAEALRVQFFWSFAGLPKSVSANYMQRQRNELDWIRNVSSSLSSPYHYWKESFQTLSKSEQVNILKIVKECWIDEQFDYFEKREKKMTFSKKYWETLAWTFAASALLQIVGMLILEIFPNLYSGIISLIEKSSLPILLCIASLLFGVLYWFSRLKKECQNTSDAVDLEHDAKKGAKGFITWLSAKTIVWQGGLLIGFIIFLISPLISYENYTQDKCWLILTGSLILAGGLCLAWSERNFFTDHQRNYLAMRDLFYFAGCRMEKLLGKLQSTSENEHTLTEINDLLYYVGKEALSENAEWLIQHRTRPLDPFMGG